MHTAAWCKEQGNRLWLGSTLCAVVPTLLNFGWCYGSVRLLIVQCAVPAEI
jgi:hypothetical protein